MVDRDDSGHALLTTVGLALLGVGALCLVLAGMFLTILSTSDDPSEGMADTATWFAWAGTSLAGVGLLVKAAGAASLGGRAAYACVGAFILVNSVAGAGILSSFFGFGGF